MPTIEEIRQQKLQDLQQKYQEQQEQEVRVAQQIEQLEQLARAHLTKEAMSRFGNLKAAHPEKAIQLLVVLAQLIQSGHKQIDDEQLKQILIKLNQKKQFNITRK